MPSGKTHWIPYLKPRPFEAEDVERAQEELGVRFPDAFVRALREHHGMSAEPGRVVDSRGKARSFGHFWVLTESGSGSRVANLVDWTQRQRRKGYPDYLVPFSSLGAADHFALSYRSGADSPKVVYVYPDGEGDAESRGFWSLIDMADSFEAFMNMLDIG